MIGEVKDAVIEDVLAEETKALGEVFSQETQIPKQVERGTKLSTQGLSVYYGSTRVLENINLRFREKTVTAIMGPSGCGKSTLLKTFDRMIELVPDARVDGAVFLDNQNILDPRVDVTVLRKRVGMVFQKPNPFPLSIFENVAFGPRVHGIRDKTQLAAIVKDSLQKAGLYEEVADKLQKPGSTLSGGQQQRLCIARALAVEPEVILLDEPTSALDPSGALRIEQLITSLKENYTVIIVTHNMQQAARVADFTAFLYKGNLVEYGETTQMFENPKEELTERYITGKFG